MQWNIFSRKFKGLNQKDKSDIMIYKKGSLTMEQLVVIIFVLILLLIGYVMISEGGQGLDQQCGILSKILGWGDC